MPLIAKRYEPIFGLGWLSRFLMVPSKKSTEKSRLEAKRRIRTGLETLEIVADFADGALQPGDLVFLKKGEGESPFEFLGAHHGQEYPEAFVFQDDQGSYVIFQRPEALLEYRIVRPRESSQD